MRALAVLAPLVVASLSCTGTTGYQLVNFYAAAVGPADATAGQPYEFTSDHGFDVVLTKAVIHVGAMYLDQSLPTSGQQQEPCTLPGTYVGEVRGGLDLDMLSSDPQGFPVTGDGSTIPAAVAQVWLTGGDVFAASDPTIVLSVAGTATKDGVAIAFTGDIAIDQSESPAQPGSALPGENPLCQQRIVSPILVDITLAQAGTLLLHLDPVALFNNVDFSTLPQFSSDPPSFGFTNPPKDQASNNLYGNLRAAGAVYRFEWVPRAN